MKTLIVITLCFLASVASAQDTNAVIFSNGSVWMTNSTYTGYGFVGGLTQSYPPSPPPPQPDGGVLGKTSAETASIYPNPSTGTFEITAPDESRHVRATLYNERGAFVVDATPFLTRTADKLQFTLHGVSSGSYEIVLDDGNERYSYRLSIRN